VQAYIRPPDPVGVIDTTSHYRQVASLSRSLRPVYLSGTGHYVPGRLVDNFELFNLPAIRRSFDSERARISLRKIDPDAADTLSDPEVFDLWARQLTGIARRSMVPADGGTTSEDLCARASLRALDHAGIASTDLDFLVVANLTAQEIVPNAASTLGALIDAPALPGFVLNTACSGFLHALSVGFMHITTGESDAVLVVSGDALTRVTDYGDPKTAVLFGDGAGAAVLTSRPGPGRVLSAPVLAAEYSADHLNLMGQGWGPDDADHKISMAGGANVLRHAIRTMREVATSAVENAGLTWDDVDFVVPHQANERITVGLERALKLSKGRVIHAIEDIGNVSASTVPITLDRLIQGEFGSLSGRSQIVLTAVGGGYASGAVAIEWTFAD